MARRRGYRIDRHACTELGWHVQSRAQRCVRGLTDGNEDDTGGERYSATNAIQGFCKQLHIWIVGVAVKDLSINVRGDEAHCDRGRKTQRTVENSRKHHHARNGARCVSDLSSS